MAQVIMDPEAMERLPRTTYLSNLSKTQARPPRVDRTLDWPHILIWAPTMRMPNLNQLRLTHKASMSPPLEIIWFKWPRTEPGI